MSTAIARTRGSSSTTRTARPVADADNLDSATLQHGGDFFGAAVIPQEEFNVGEEEFLRVEWPISPPTVVPGIICEEAQLMFCKTYD
jgi:hypothetical protein